MRVIHKLSFDLRTDVPVRETYLPLYAKFLHVERQRDQLCLWYEWDNDIPAKERHRFTIVGTGLECPEDSEYVGTAIFYDGDLVLHLFHRKV